MVSSSVCDKLVQNVAVSNSGGEGGSRSSLWHDQICSNSSRQVTVSMVMCVA